MIQTISQVLAGVVTGLMVVSAIGSIRSGIKDRDRVRIGLGIGWAMVAVFFTAAAVLYLK